MRKVSLQIPDSPAKETGSVWAIAALLKLSSSAQHSSPHRLRLHVVQRLCACVRPRRRNTSTYRSHSRTPFILAPSVIPLQDKDKQTNNGHAMNEEMEDKGEQRGSIRESSVTMSDSASSQEGLHQDARSKPPPPLLPSASLAVTASPSTSISTAAVPAHLARADSGASSVSSSSSSAGSCDSYGAPSTTLSCSSAPSSLFSSSETGDRRSSFASSVWESEEEENHKDKDDEDAVNTPSAPLRASIARTVSDSGSSVASESASSDSASTSTAANMATPTVELGQLHLLPSSSSSSSITAASPSLAAGLSSATSPVHASRVRPPVTSPDMLRYAQRVTAMGAQYGHFPAGHRKSATASPGVSTPSSASSSSTVRPSLSHSASSTASSEGFPWTARPSTGQPTSSSNRYHSTSTSSRPSTSSSVHADIRPSAARMTSSSSLVATPSAIFSGSLEEADDDEEAAEAYARSVRDASPQHSRSHLESQNPSSIATNIGSLQNGTHRQSAALASGAMTASLSADDTTTTTTTVREDDDSARSQQWPYVAASPSSSLQSTSRDPLAYAHSSRGQSQNTPQRLHQEDRNNHQQQQHALPRSSDIESPRRSATSPFIFEAPPEPAMAAAALAHPGTDPATMPARTSPTHHHTRPLQQQLDHVQQHQAKYISSNSKARAGDAAAVLPPIGGPSSVKSALYGTASTFPSSAFSLDSFTMSPTYGGTASQASTVRSAAATQSSRARDPSVDSHNTTASIGSGSLYTSCSGHSSGNWSAYSGSTAHSSIGGGSSSNSSVRDSGSGLHCQLGSHGSIAGILAQSCGPPAQQASTTRPSTSSSTLSSGTRPWIKDSDAASVKSSSGLSSEGSCDSSEKEPSVMSPAAPPPVPFLSTGPSPAGCKIQVDTSNPDHFDVIVTLPGFSLENITLALKRNGSLHILADKYDDIASLATEGDDAHGGHFERMVELGETAIGAKVTAEFDGKRLKVVVKKRDSGPKQTTSRPRHHHSSLDLLGHR